MISRNKAKRLLKSVVTEEMIDLVKNGNRVVNEKKIDSFEKILSEVLDDSEKNGFKVKYALCDKINPLSGFISIVGKNINLTNIERVRKYMSDVTYISIENYSEEETSIIIGFQNVIELVRK